jgi:hypothetical protein
MKPTVEQLMAMIEEKGKKKRRVENLASVVRYIDETKIEAGTIAVPTYVIFWHYRCVFPGDRHHKAAKIPFFRTFNKRFPQYRQGDQRYYLIKEGVFPMDDASLKEAKIYDSKYWAKKEKTTQSVEQKYSIEPST